MKHFQYSVMSLGILLRSLGWVTTISGEISFSPPGHTSSYFMTGPLHNLGLREPLVKKTSWI